MGVDIEFDASTNVLAILYQRTAQVTNTTIYLQVFNNAGSGKTGDIDFTTVGHSDGDAYSIILVLTKHF